MAAMDKEGTLPPRVSPAEEASAFTAAIFWATQPAAAQV